MSINLPTSLPLPLPGNRPSFPGGPQVPGAQGPGDLPDITLPGFEGGPQDPGKPLDPNAPNPQPGNHNSAGDPGAANGGGLFNNGTTPGATGDPLRDLANPNSRMLPGQSAQNSNAPFNTSPTQYPAPTLSERALNNAAQFASLDRPTNFNAVPAAMANASSANVQGNALPNAAVLPNGASNGALANAAASNATASNVAAPSLTLVANNTPNAVPAAPMAAAMNQDALIAQQNVLARLANPQHANPPGASGATAAPPPSETSATLPSIQTNTLNNDARNQPLNLNDRIAQQRGDGLPNNQIYTGESMQRRPLRRGGRVDNASLTQWLSAFGRGGVHRPTHEHQPSLEVVRALQWLFWVLTVAAYVCLAMAVVLLLPDGSLITERASPGGSGVALLLGVAVAAGAWWLGRRLNRR
ncbi:hypothetical protein [Lysobacter capsici]|uniref:hypothetical protein n=1 Tax=Lysobacter capsici TaxID=435897 RepID=UPI00287BB2C0|nr:hypothetical protein [Lysobacter capsici]WND80991.1 hypothetical protein RJ610_01030 [Lysobacter capsici]WND86187.1 hypothetical protein RJ609_01030 [Lysobacter capsici]